MLGIRNVSQDCPVQISLFYVVKVSVSFSLSWDFVESVSISVSKVVAFKYQSQYQDSWITGLSLNIDIKKLAPKV